MLALTLVMLVAARGPLAEGEGEGPTPPLEWTCSPQLYGDGAGCDCGCGAVDVDCGASDDIGLCRMHGCPAGRVPLAADTTRCVANTCGDGYVGGEEKCDDGDGEGCSEDCSTVTDGYRCSSQGQGCGTPRCGDRIVDVDEGERCDDGNEDIDDGCAACVPERGFVCTLFNGCHRTQCADGEVEYDWETRTGETCEDDDVLTGDGCDEVCNSEQGYACDAYAPSCTPTVCGNGRLERGTFEDGEGCDDGGRDDGDGCSADCVAEEGYQCDWEGCYPVVCGDFILARSAEGCDDGDTDAGDGCDEQCRPEAGFSCNYEAGPCHLVTCGDGVQESDDLGTVWEQCDDDNTDDGDGCSAACTREPGYVCDLTNSCHRIVCGDGIVDQDEQGGVVESCDDGDDDAGDGCSDTCQLEEGWSCAIPGEPCVQPVCGDSTLEGDERCDDGNDDDGDGCSSGCTREPDWVCPNPGAACEPLPQAWKCSVYVYSAGDGCDCGCGIVDPDCGDSPTPATCDYNQCLADTPYVDPADVGACTAVPPAPTEGEGEGEPAGEGEGEAPNETVDDGGCSTIGASGLPCALALLLLQRRRRADRELQQPVPSVV